MNLYDKVTVLKHKVCEVNTFRYKVDTK